jgi:hypothetical protein
MVSPMTTGMGGDSSATQAEPGMAKPWLDLISDAEKYFSVYQQKMDNLDKQLGELKALAEGSVDREFKMFWANLEVLKPSIYARPPIPVVVPRFKDRREINRIASDLLERCLVVSFDRDDVNSVMVNVRDDLAVSGRGTAWVRYEAAGETEADFTERLCFDHVDRMDFLHDPARNWREVDWGARGSWLSIEKFKKRFPHTLISSVQFDQGKDKGSEYKGEKKARVWEIWHKGKKKVIWVSPGCETTLDEQDPPIKLDGFFPFPKPAFGTLQRRTTLPIPDYVQYKDQLEEINILTSRISNLADGLKLKGFYAAGSEDIGTAVERAIRSKDDSLVIPVSNFAALGGAGLKDALIWLPIREVAETIVALVSLRKQLIDDVYQITGMSDIMRGSSDPNETLGAQELKSQYGSIRIRDKQGELVRFARDLARIGGEIMAENFQSKTLLSMSQMQIPSQEEVQGQIQQIVQQAAQMAQSPDAQMAAQQDPQAIEQAKQQVMQQVQQLEQTVTIEKLVEMMRDQRLRPFILDIETDSTIQPNEDAEKARRTEFMTALGGFIQQSAPLVQQMPASGPFVAEAIKFVADAFRAGRPLQGAIEDFGTQITQIAQQPKGPSPEEVKAKAEADALQKKTEAELQLKKADIDAKVKIAEITVQQKREEAAIKAEDHRRTMEANAQAHEHVQGEREHQAKVAQMESERAATDHQRKMDFDTQTHSQKQKEAMVSAGIPADYSFKEDRDAFNQALTMMAQMLSEISTQSAAIQQGQESIAKAISAPRKMRGRDGFEFVSEAQVK